MAKTKAKYDEIDDIREDLTSLKNNVVELSRSLKKDGISKTGDVKDSAMLRLENLKGAGQRRIGDVEDRVKDKPVESVAIAFAAGLAASLLLRR